MPPWYGVARSMQNFWILKKHFSPLRNVAETPLSVTSFFGLYVQISLIASFDSYTEIY